MFSVVFTTYNLVAGTPSASTSSAPTVIGGFPDQATAQTALSAILTALHSGQGNTDGSLRSRGAVIQNS